jgi:hypothetical protein
MPQITGYLDESERAALTQYARQFGLDGSGLANLLLSRELRVGRLGMLKSSAIEGGKRVKITAHQPNNSVFQLFKEHARSQGMRAGPALACLIHAELSERWLEKAIARV